MHQKWEYKIVLRERDSAYQQWSNEVNVILPELGEEGWELVAISFRDNQSMGNSARQQEVWVFKRPKL